jgi:hypothetical protein
MMRFLMLAMAVAVLSAGCHGKIVVREAKVYKAELQFIDAATQEISERSQSMLNLKCECEEVAGEKGFVSKECQQLAETVVVLKARMAYHTNMMRYLGGLIEERPPKDPPEVPAPNTLCKE